MLPKHSTSMYFVCRDKKCLGSINLEQPKKYGIIKNLSEIENNVDGLKLPRVDNPGEDGNFLNICEVQGSYLYKTSKNMERITEYNPDLTIMNANRSLWTYPEIEHKLNVLEPQERFWKTFDTLEIPFYSRSECITHTSYEKITLLKYGRNFSKVAYIDILSRTKNESPNAIKYKTP